ncbi:hypothetical protein ACFY7H_24880 [Streptomyces sp. NPDC012794]|uniref:hypothetical protein n=1 Tax=Streptomyces sp. NPDC012794 TaxID=3364850 RepID=UPI003692AB6E
MLQKSGSGEPGRAVLHAVDRTEAPQGAPLLPLERALDVAEQPGHPAVLPARRSAGTGPVLLGFDSIEGG